MPLIVYRIVMGRHKSVNSYFPDDAKLSLETLTYLQTPEGRQLLEQIDNLPSPQAPSASKLTRLRKFATMEQVHAALTILAGRKKAEGPHGKFSEIAKNLWATPEALEQATSLRLARYKATQFSKFTNIAAIHDFCCGMGGDALGLATLCPVHAYDLSSVRIWCVQQNAALLNLPVTAICTDITQIPLRENLQSHEKITAFHIDPSRRSAGKRSHAYQDLIPGPDFLEKLIAIYPFGAIKLSPGVDFHSLPMGHLEIISENGIAVQALLWTGSASPMPPSYTRTATIIRTHEQAWSFTGQPSPSVFSETPARPGENDPLYELDPAIHRAGLAMAFLEKTRAIPLSVDAGYFFTKTPIPPAFAPAVTNFRHLTTVQMSQLADQLKKLCYEKQGPVEIKTRGGLDVDTDALQKKLSKITPYAFTIFIYRGFSGLSASIALRL